MACFMNHDPKLSTPLSLHNFTKTKVESEWSHFTPTLLLFYKIVGVEVEWEWSEEF